MFDIVIIPHLNEYLSDTDKRFNNMLIISYKNIVHHGRWSGNQIIRWTFEFEYLNYNGYKSTSLKKLLAKLDE